jgi:D-serine deaminase-like pyridoxal phosphate-dependent protein
MFPEIDTPAVLIDLDVTGANIDRYQAYCDEHGLGLRPHIKTHKLPRLARRQLAAGAVGITCQKVTEAEAMISEGGIDDVLITYNILGDEKLTRLRALAERVRLAVVADNETVVDGLSRTFADAAAPLRVLVECDTGANRCGVPTPEAARDLALRIDAAPGLAFGGLMTLPGPRRHRRRPGMALHREDGLRGRRADGGDGLERRLARHVARPRGAGRHRVPRRHLHLQRPLPGGTRGLQL